MTSVETRVQNSTLTAIENLVIPRVELAMKSANAHPEQSVDGNVLEPDQRDFLGNIEGLRMTAPSRINSHTGLNKIDETRSNITVEEGDLLVNEKNIDRQTYAHHSQFLLPGLFFATFRAGKVDFVSFLTNTLNVYHGAMQCLLGLKKRKLKGRVD